MTELASWDSFYMIVGPSAGALIGLQFVVLTLIAARPPRGGGSGAAGAAYATPTIIHFSVVLFLAAVLRAPWATIMPVAALCGLVGLVGTGYAVVTTLRMQRQTTYRPDLEDFLFHAILPLAAYLLLAFAAAAALARTHDALFAVGSAALLLLFIGIHNAWDATLYHVFANNAPPGKE